MRNTQMRIYIASSWKNQWHDLVVSRLRKRGYCVYNYREKNADFSWEGVDPDYKNWTSKKYLKGLLHRDASEAFWQDMSALDSSDVVVAIEPLGVSSALELGWASGWGKPTILMVTGLFRPELMARIAQFRVSSPEDLIAILEGLDLQSNKKKRRGMRGDQDARS